MENQPRYSLGAETAGKPGAVDMRWHRIARILERRVVPSLLLDPEVIVPVGVPTNAQLGQTDALIAMSLQGRVHDAEQDLRALFDQGASFDQLQLGLLAPAAERLGVLWEEDRLSFVDVTVATGNLQRLMQFVAIDLAELPNMGGERSICIFPEPGAQHTFGAAMAAKYLQHAGWHVDYVADTNRSTLYSILETRRVDVVAVSLSRESEADRAQDLLNDLKARSKNPDVVSIAGGSVFSRTPELIPGFQADAVVAAVRGAPALLTRLVAEHHR